MYHSSSYWTHTDTCNVCLDLLNCRYSIFIFVRKFACLISLLQHFYAVKPWDKKKERWSPKRVSILMKFPRQNKKKVTAWVGMTLFILWLYKKRLVHTTKKFGIRQHTRWRSQWPHSYSLIHGTLLFPNTYTCTYKIRRHWVFWQTNSVFSAVHSSFSIR